MASIHGIGKIVWKSEEWVIMQNKLLRTNSQQLAQ